MKTNNSKGLSIVSNRLPKLLTALAFAALVVTGCAKDNPVTPAASWTYIKPTAGSTFTSVQVHTDSTGAVTHETPDTITTTVVQTDASVLGKTGVIKLVNIGKYTTDTSSYAVMSNNDIAELMNLEDLGLSKFWVTIPVASEASVVSVQADSTESSPGVFSTVRATVTSRFTGTGSLTVQSTAIPTKKLSMLVHLEHFLGGVRDQDLSLANEFEYAPSLGMIVKQVQPPMRDISSGDWIEGMIQTVVAYLVK